VSNSKILRKFLKMKQYKNTCIVRIKRLNLAYLNNKIYRIDFYSLDEFGSEPLLINFEFMNMKKAFQDKNSEFNLTELDMDYILNLPIWVDFNYYSSGIIRISNMTRD
jgi:hypothetical protein